MKIITLLLLLTTNVLSQGNVKRLFSHDSIGNIDFTRRYSYYALGFKSPLCCEGDTIWVSALSDSISEGYTFKLYTYFPRNINPLNSVMFLNYTDNTYETLYQIGFPDEDNYVEYYVISQVYDSIFKKKVKSITFRGIGTFKVKDKSFFINFHKEISQ